jgi:hypothetical protein
MSLSADYMLIAGFSTSQTRVLQPALSCELRSLRIYTTPT